MTEQSRLTKEEITRTAEMLETARLSGVWISELPPELSPRNEPESYRIQDEVEAISGRQRVGWKLGCTGLLTQQLLGASGPIYGKVYADKLDVSPHIVVGQRPDVLIVEVEFAFVMRGTMPSRSEPYSEQEVLTNIATCHPALEYIGSTFVDWKKCSLPEIIADNAGHGGLVLGEPIKQWSKEMLPSSKVRLLENDLEVAAGSGADVLGNPINCLVWLANFLSEQGKHLAEGDVITTGTCTGAQNVTAGQLIKGDFGALGTVSLTFAP